MCYLSGNELSRAEYSISCVSAPGLCGEGFSALCSGNLCICKCKKNKTKPLELYCAVLCSKQETSWFRLQWLCIISGDKAMLDMFFHTSVDGFMYVLPPHEWTICIEKICFYYLLFVMWTFKAEQTKEVKTALRWLAVPCWCCVLLTSAGTLRGTWIG